MRYKRLGRSNLDVSVVGLGCWAIGGRGWGRVDDRESLRAVATALDAGVNFFDTADIYGFGHSETVLGRALRTRPEAIVATKVGLRRDEAGRVLHDLTPRYIAKACEASLRRLRRDRLDLYLIHWPDPAVPFTDTLAALSALTEAGRVRYVGASNLGAADFEAAASLPNFIAYQGRFNFLQPPDPQIARRCRRENIGFIASEPLCKGILSGKYREAPLLGRRDHRRSLACFNEGFRAAAGRAERLRTVAERHGVSPAALALALLLDDCTVAVPGAKTAAQAAENAEAAAVRPEIVTAARRKLHCADPNCALQ